MDTTHIATPRLTLVLESHDDARARIEGTSPAERAQFSADWLARVYAATAPDPWVHGFAMVHRSDHTVVGYCGFKAPPTDDGVVEIAYGVAPEHQGKGYATEAAHGLTSYAFGTSQVRVVRAHTLPEASASTRVLTKCGFQRVGEVIDPDDGLVWRWEKFA